MLHRILHARARRASSNGKTSWQGHKTHNSSHQRTKVGRSLGFVGQQVGIVNSSPPSLHCPTDPPTAPYFRSHFSPSLPRRSFFHADRQAALMTEFGQLYHRPRRTAAAGWFHFLLHAVDGERPSWSALSSSACSHLKDNNMDDGPLERKGFQHEAAARNL